MVRKKIENTAEKMDTINKAVNLKLEDLDGIGPVKLKKLYANGIHTVDQLTSYGEEWLVRNLDISWEDAKKLTQIASESMNTDDIFSSMIVSGEEYDDYRKKRIEFLTTGHEEFDEVTGGYESGVITELFGLFGSGKTQFMMVASIMAQLPVEACCLSCGKTEPPVEPTKEEDDYKIKLEFVKDGRCDCGGTLWKGGGLSTYGKPSRVIYIDTENSYRPIRVFQIVCNRDLVKTKKQSITQVKKKEDKEPLDDDEYEKAMEFIRNIDVVKPKTSALQMTAVSNLSSQIDGDMCKICHRRAISNSGDPTHKDHPKAKDDMVLMDHDFVQDKPAKLVIIDSITGKFRKEFEGRGQLSDRQVKLSAHVRLLEGTVESKNVVCLVTNQAQEALGLAGTHADNVRPVGGNVLGHTFTTRIYLKKGQSITKDKITAIIIDSPDHAKNEVVMELGGKGIQKLTED